MEAAQLAGHWQEALQAVDSLAVEHPDDPTYQGMRGVISVHLGNRVAGGQAAGRLAAWPTNRLGETSLWRARIAAVLGEPGRAVALLQDATAEGSLALALYDDDPDLESLRDVPAFRALRASKE